MPDLEVLVSFSKTYLQFVVKGRYTNYVSQKMSFVNPLPL